MTRAFRRRDARADNKLPRQDSSGCCCLLFRRDEARDGMTQ